MNTVLGLLLVGNLLYTDIPERLFDYGDSAAKAGTPIERLDNLYGNYVGLVLCENFHYITNGELAEAKAKTKANADWLIKKYPEAAKQADDIWKSNVEKFNVPATRENYLKYPGEARGICRLTINKTRAMATPTADEQIPTPAKP